MAPLEFAFWHSRSLPAPSSLHTTGSPWVALLISLMHPLSFDTGSPQLWKKVASGMKSDREHPYTCIKGKIQNNAPNYPEWKKKKSPKFIYRTTTTMEHFWNNKLLEMENRWVIVRGLVWGWRAREKYVWLWMNSEKDHCANGTVISF